MMQVNQKPLQTAFVYGLVSGIALGVSEIALGVLTTLIPYPMVLFIGRLALILLVLAYLYAGYNAARRSGSLFAGTLAGALTGAFGVATIVFLSYLAAFLHMYLQFDPQMLSIPLSTSPFFLMLSPLTRVMITFAFYGAIVGTVGGFVGRRRSLY